MRDRNGKPVQAGDDVILRGNVGAVDGDLCSVVLETGVVVRTRTEWVERALPEAAVSGPPPDPAPKARGGGKAKDERAERTVEA